MSVFQNYTLFHDEFFNAMYDEQPELVQTLLRAVHEDESIVVDEVMIQKVVPNLPGHASRLDIVAHGHHETNSKCVWNNKIQRNEKDAPTQRA